jgi:hypothetical protein
MPFPRTSDHAPVPPTPPSLWCCNVGMFGTKVWGLSRACGVTRRPGFTRTHSPPNTLHTPSHILLKPLPQNRNHCPEMLLSPLPPPRHGTDNNQQSSSSGARTCVVTTTDTAGQVSEPSYPPPPAVPPFFIGVRQQEVTRYTHTLS